MPSVHRIGDPNDAGGVIINPLTVSVFANGLLVAVVGATVASHAPCPYPPIHCAAVVVTGSPDVIAEGISVARTGDLDSCAHTRASGSPDVIAN